jgi:hypothetical protein
LALCDFVFVSLLFLRKNFEAVFSKLQKLKQNDRKLGEILYHMTVCGP